MSTSTSVPEGLSGQQQQPQPQQAPAAPLPPQQPQASQQLPGPSPTSYSPTASSGPAYQPQPPTVASFVPVQETRPQEQAPAAPMAGSPQLSAQTQNPRQRSSIACLHCRRSKIRCVNTGIDTQCNACRNSGRECRYSVEISKRGRPGEDDADRTPKRTKNRKSEAAAGDAAGRARTDAILNGDFQGRELKEGAPALVEEGILNPEILTPQTWSELYDLFETHYGTDLPFLHAPTFSKRLRESPDLHPSIAGTTEQPKKSYDSMRAPGWELLVLGILALTARFHPAVTRHLCASRPGEKEKDPVYASEYYASVLRSCLVGSRGNYIGTPNLAKIQALLMLGLYEWGICKGVKAWIHVGLAIRMAQAMGLQFEDDQEYQPLALSSATRFEAIHVDIGGIKPSSEPVDPTSNDAFIEEEMRRRTFWSCFIMDRYLSSGKYRPSMLMLDDIRLQLPCSQNHFLFGDRVCTSLIDGTCSGTGARTKRKAAIFRQWQRRSAASGERGQSREDDATDVQIQCEYGTIEGAISIHIRMVEIWGRIVKWTCAGGIRTEQYPPWHEKSTFFQLKEALRRFQSTLPRLYRLSKMNIEAHISQHTSSPYILLQLLYALCTIVVHRELVPFVPVRCDSPQGPLDFVPYAGDSPKPPNFYVESARILFGVVRDIMDLVQACHGRCHLPETPVMGFGLYAVTSMEVYALNFPHMDPDGFVSGRQEVSNQPPGGVKAVNRMLEIIQYMRPRIPMADCWFRTIHRVHRYYKKIISDFEANPRALATHGVPRSLNLQTLGGGAEGLGPLELLFKKFGNVDDEDVNSWTSSPTLSTPQPRNVLPINGGEQRPFEHHRPESWAAVNTSDPHRPNSSSVPRSDYQHYSTNTPSYASDGSSALQPPGLSRGNTPTPSAASASPYQGPSAPGGTEESPHGGQPQSLQQQLAHHATQVTSSAHSAPSSAPQAPSLPIHANSGNRYDPTQPSIKTESGGAGAVTHTGQPANDQQQQSTNNSSSSGGLSVSSADLNKSLGGDDVAAFMDGVSCEEWMEAASRAVTGLWGATIGNGGMGGVGRGGMGDGWLSRVWRS